MTIEIIHDKASVAQLDALSTADQEVVGRSPPGLATFFHGDLHIEFNILGGLDTLSGETTLSKLLGFFFWFLLKKDVYPKRKEFASHGSKSFPFREDPLPGKQTSSIKKMSYL